VQGGAPARGIDRSNPVSAERGSTHEGRLGILPGLSRCLPANHLIPRQRVCTPLPAFGGPDLQLAAPPDTNRVLAPQRVAA